MSDSPSSTERIRPKVICLYGPELESYLAPVIEALGRAVGWGGGELALTTPERAWRHRPFTEPAESLYILPFDAMPEDAPADAGAFIEACLPKVPIATSMAVQDLCDDRLATQERLLTHGVPMPETLVTDSFGEMKRFVRRHEAAVLRDPRQAGGLPDIVLWVEGGQVFGDCGSHRYQLMKSDADRPRLVGDELHHPGPFYLQRLIAKFSRGNVVPGPSLRAYVVAGEVRFWTERSRSAYRRPAEWVSRNRPDEIVRFVQDVSSDAEKAAVRAAEAVGARHCAVDIVRTAGAGPCVRDIVVDGRHTIVDRSYKSRPEFRDHFNFDRHLGFALVPHPEVVAERAAAAVEGRKDENQTHVWWNSRDSGPTRKR